MRRFRRSDRLSEELLKEVSAIIRSDMKDPRIGNFVSLTRVTLNNNLHRANVYVSVFGPDSEKNDTIKALRHATGYVRRLIGKRMRIRKAPEITFIMDDSIEYSARIDAKLKEALPDPGEDSDGETE